MNTRWAWGRNANDAQRLQRSAPPITSPSALDQCRRCMRPLFESRLISKVSKQRLGGGVRDRGESASSASCASLFSRGGAFVLTGDDRTLFPPLTVEGVGAVFEEVVGRLAAVLRMMMCGWKGMTGLSERECHRNIGRRMDVIGCNRKRAKTDDR